MGANIVGDGSESLSRLSQKGLRAELGKEARYGQRINRIPRESEKLRLGLHRRKQKSEIQNDIYDPGKRKGPLPRAGPRLHENGGGKRRPHLRLPRRGAPDAHGGEG